ncbi:HvfC/BufC N-terminal domain-containing protein [Undibacterium flavidum]|uniref:DNA-binding domain-containing protein n=1 Tax=Undibacterium flavidum TaxID=2762297 RepID=A0ABR6YHI7_9BURK|nr:DNA-binding domain-containing protein [Undibacterium flavidum]MBC3876044.1 putative DNA-binding domain-containing protein [Undibacterium flavidum]
MNKESSLSLQAIQETVADLLLNRDQIIPNAMFAGDFAINAERLRIYRGNLHAVWINALRNAYPVICRLVGDAFFEQLSILYGHRFPSQSGDLNVFGQDFAKFLQDEASVSEFPYFSAVAALEWQQHLAYYSADFDALDLMNFLSTAGENAAQYAFEFHPAVALVQADFAAVQICLAHRGEQVQALDIPLNTTSYALVSRKDWRVELTQLSQAEYIALQALRAGSSLGMALERALELGSEIDFEFDIATALQHWFQRGIFIEFRCKD